LNAISIWLWVGFLINPNGNDARNPAPLDDLFQLLIHDGWLVIKFTHHIE
jgi:hypothetical protein